MLYVVNGQLTHTKPLDESADKEIAPIDEENDQTYGGYKMHYHTESDGVHLDVKKGSKVVYTCYAEDPHEVDEVYKMIDDGSIDEELNEEYDPFKDLKKVKSDMKKGLYTDGMGGVYEAPKSGLSHKIKKGKYQFAYDFKGHELVVFYQNKELDRVGLNLGDWLDDPDYWISVWESDQEDLVNNYLNDLKSGSSLSEETRLRYRGDGSLVSKHNVNVVIYNLLEDARNTEDKSELKAILKDVKAFIKKYPYGGDESVVKWSVIGGKLKSAEKKFASMK